jgi:DNA adenine methylase
MPSEYIEKDKKIQYEESKIKRTTNKEVLLSYIGTKHNYINEISKHININESNKIYDLFVGSCTIPYFLEKIFTKNKIIINDINNYIINFYNTLKNNKSELITRIEELNTIENIKNYQNLLYIINNNDSSNIDKASAYYILNKISYNGKVFYDKNNKINIHSYKKGIINIDKDRFNNFSNFLKNVEINNKCLLDSTDYWLNRMNKGDIVILDPPYDILSIQNNHYMNNFNREEQEKLCIFINKIKQKGVKIITFNGNTLFIKKLYRNFNINIIESKTHINKNKNYNELLIHN